MPKFFIVERKDAPRVKPKNWWCTEILISTSDGEGFELEDLKISVVDYDCGDYGCSAVDVNLNNAIENSADDVLSAIRTLERAAKLLRQKHKIRRR